MKKLIWLLSGAMLAGAISWGQEIPAPFAAPQPTQAPQQPQIAQQAPMDLSDVLDMARLNAEEARMKAAEMKMDMAFQGLDLANNALNLGALSGLDNLKSQIAMMQIAPRAPMPPMPPKGRIYYGSDSSQYESGTRLLDERKYDEAIPHFDRVINAKADRADGALYWKAYALNRIGRRDEALASLAALRRDYPSSHWLNDAQALQAEVQQNAGHPVSPADETNDDIKLMAINSLMNADPDRAVPLLEGLLKSGNSPKLKDRALFVLTQSRSPKAEQILADYAKGAGNPDLQLRAIRYVGMAGTADAQQQLAAIYKSSNDPAVKREIVRQLASTGASDRLLEIVRSEKDPSLRMEGIRYLSTSRSTTPEILVSMYTADTDERSKRELINGLHSRGDVKPLIEIARKESDPKLKLFIIERIGTMHSKEATDFMMELLK